MVLALDSLMGFFPSNLEEKPMPRLPDPELMAAWEARLASFERSQLTVAEFCEVENVSVASFYQWRRKLEGQAGSVGTRRREGGEFIAVRLRSAPQTARLSLPGGATIELPSGLESDRLRELIAAVIEVTSRAADHSTEEI
jgi:hypothetical protein